MNDSRGKAIQKAKGGKKIKPVSKETSDFMYRKVNNQFKQEEMDRHFSGYYKRMAK